MRTWGNKPKTARQPAGWKQTGAYALACAVSGVIYALGFAGFDIWPLAFLGLVPLLAALTWGRVGVRRGFWGGWLMGTVAYALATYWVVGMLEVFTTFHAAINWLVSTLLWGFQGLMFGVFAAVFVALRPLLPHVLLRAIVAFLPAEWLVPTIFRAYFANALHPVPLLIQIADIGGPMLVSALLVTVNAAIFAVAHGYWGKGPKPWRMVGAAAGALLVTLGYGAWRMAHFDRQSAAAPALNVGLVQANMGTTAKREAPAEGLRRHLKLSESLIAAHPEIELLFWPESAFSYYLSAEHTSLAGTALGGLERPLLFGGLYGVGEGDARRHFNSAFLMDKGGALLSRYDKHILMPFGEYIPFGETFPALYDLSPASGRFGQGTSFAPLVFGEARIGALVCYEDLVPHFVRTAMTFGKPNLLVNLTNDAWFGDSTEPWIHLALAKFRAIEARRYLVRSTNSGVSAIIDASGRVTAHGPVFEEATLAGPVALLEGRTVYQTIGDFPAYLSLLTLVLLSGLHFRRRRKNNA